MLCWSSRYYQQTSIDKNHQVHLWLCWWTSWWFERWKCWWLQMPWLLEPSWLSLWHGWLLRIGCWWRWRRYVLFLSLLCRKQKLRWMVLSKKLTSPISSKYFFIKVMQLVFVKDHRSLLQMGFAMMETIIRIVSLMVEIVASMLQLYFVQNANVFTVSTCKVPFKYEWSSETLWGYHQKKGHTSLPMLYFKE